MSRICCRAFQEASESGKFIIKAYVLMPDHAHLITSGGITADKMLRFLKGISARRIIDQLKTENAFSSLKKLQVGMKERNYKYSLWQHHSNARRIDDLEELKSRAEYIHQNPFRGGLVKSAEGYLCSSARIWEQKPLDNEPLKVLI